MKKIVSIALTAVMVFSLSACANKSSDNSIAQVNAKEISSPSVPVITEEELGLRKGSLYTEQEVTPIKTQYTSAAPGTVEKLDRAFENAPPMIPHSVKGLLPITKNNNSCLGCHMPEVASSVGATAIPKSHFMDFRSQKMLNNLSQQRFNCTQCHAPQANVPSLVKNKFEPAFRSTKDKERSNLIDKLNEGVN